MSHSSTLLAKEDRVSCLPFEKLLHNLLEHHVNNLPSMIEVIRQPSMILKIANKCLDCKKIYPILRSKKGLLPLPINDKVWNYSTTFWTREWRAFVMVIADLASRTYQTIDFFTANQEEDQQEKEEVDRVDAPFQTKQSHLSQSSSCKPIKSD